ncbi:Calreticulin [Glycine soja]|nr:Calreticulin [Glycine soja]
MEVGKVLTDGKIVELNQIGKKDENLTGEWNHTSGQWNGDANDKGIQTSEDYRFYVISAEYPELGLFVSPDLNQDYLFDVDIMEASSG